MLIVSSLQKRADIRAISLIRSFKARVEWEPLSNLLIESDAWKHAVIDKKLDPKLVFCHPDILLGLPSTSLYYRGLCGLSLKAVRDYFGAVDSIESGSSRGKLDGTKALKMARTYNAFICSIIQNSTNWTLENGYRTVIATLGITLDGVMRNKVGVVAEERVCTMVTNWLRENGLIVERTAARAVRLKDDVVMKFGSEPDIAFRRGDILLATIEIKGGTDPAGALERYGAATKSFRNAIAESPQCENIYLAAVLTPELKRRIAKDRLVKKTFDIIEILAKPESREKFFKEVFHYTLRIT